MRDLVTSALIAKGLVLVRQGRQEDSLRVFEAIDKGYGSDSSWRIREQVATAMLNKAASLRTLGRLDEEVQTYEEIERRYSGDQTPLLQERVAQARGERTKILEERANKLDGTDQAR